MIPLSEKSLSLYDATRKQAYSLRFPEEHIPGILHRALVLVSLTSCLTRPLRATGRLSLSPLAPCFFLLSGRRKGKQQQQQKTSREKK